MNFPASQRRLPIGIQAFREIRAGNFRCVDKTGVAPRLVTEAKHFFLSRPRRYGKSLFVDTLKRLFEGQRNLFRGLAIEPRWDWSVRCPVVRLEFSGGNCKRPGHLHANVMAQLHRTSGKPAWKNTTGRCRRRWNDRQLRPKAGKICGGCIWSLSPATVSCASPFPPRSAMFPRPVPAGR